MRNAPFDRAARASLYVASTAACLSIVAAGCRADPLDTGPTQASVERAVVYPNDPAVATRSGASVPSNGVIVTTDAAALAPTTRPDGVTTQPDAATTTRPADDRVVFAAPTSRPSDGTYTSDGMQQGTYDNGNPPSTDYTGTYDRGVASYGYNGYASNQYDGYSNDYWVDRNYWSASPYYYGNYVTSGYGIGYPYNYYGGRTYVYRNYDRGDRFNGRRNDSNWNERAKYRDRDDRSPRVPYPYTDRDRDGNGVDDSKDNGLNRPPQYRGDRPDRRDDDPRRTDARNEQARLAGEQRRDANQRREQTESAANDRRAENRPANVGAGQTNVRDRDDAPRRDTTPARDSSPARASTPDRDAAPARAAPPSRAADAPRNDAPRQSAPARDSAPARNNSGGGGGGAPTRGGTSSTAGGGGAGRAK